MASINYISDKVINAFIIFDFRMRLIDAIRVLANGKIGL
jgi:hypothetical protein